MTNALLGIDTGGTFTDFVLLEGNRLRVHKVLSNPGAPQDAIMQGIRDLELMPAVAQGRVTIIHGTTVATNATLEGKGVRTVYITNKGLKDVLLIGRQTRPALYDLAPAVPSRPFEDELMLEVDCRLDASGEVTRPLTREMLDALRTRVRELHPRSVAINLLFSFVDSAHEEAIEELFADDCFVARSSAVLPEYREYERGITTWINAWIGPIMHDYLTELREALSPASLSIMQSSGLTVAADQAADKAVNLLLSGPAGGLSGSMFIGTRLGARRLMTFDMGGTSTDVALVDHEIRLTNQGTVAGFPIGIPMADIHTIGAGGGSIAYVDDGGLLQVGPESAGADPGPACYGKGGERPTVTDANLVLGRLRADAFLGGRMALDRSAAEAAMTPLARELDISVTELAFGIVRIANEHMTQALRVISIQRGFDPREFTLACFGGAGGLHFCDLAETLQMRQAIVPVHSGVLSALGMLATAPGRELVQTHRAALSDVDAPTLERLFADLEHRGVEELAAEGVTDVDTRRSLDLRYRGQTFTINVPWLTVSKSEDAFHDEHERLYGHRLDKPVELLNVRVHQEAERAPIELPDVGEESAIVNHRAKLAGYEERVPVIDRRHLGRGEKLTGPVLVTEQHSTTLIKEHWVAEVDDVGNLLLNYEG